LPALIGGGLALLLVVIGLVLWLFVFDDGGAKSERAGSQDETDEAADDDNEAGDDKDDDKDDDDAPSVKTVKMDIPATSSLYADLRLAQLWRSWLFEAFEDDALAQLEGERDYARFGDRTGLEIKDFKRVQIGAETGSGPPAPIVLAHLSKLDTARFEAWLAEESGGVTAEVAGTTFYVDRKGGDGAGVIGPRRIAMGSVAALKAAASGKSWKKNKPLSEAMKRLDDDAAVRAVFALPGDLMALVPLDELPAGKSIQPNDVFGVSVSVGDALALETVYIPTGEDAESRLDTIHTEVGQLLKMVKKQKREFAEQMKGEVPDEVMQAGLAVLKSLKVKKRDGALVVKMKIKRSDLEPVIALAKSMAPPRPPKAKVKPAAEPAAKAAGANTDLPELCKRLVTCCDALVEIVPAAKAGCDAQRQAFEQANSGPAQARAAMASALEQGCTAALTGFAQMPGAPDSCSAD